MFYFFYLSLFITDSHCVWSWNSICRFSCITLFSYCTCILWIEKNQSSIFYQFNQSVNQSISQSINQSINQSIQSIFSQFNQSIQSIFNQFNQSINQPINQSINQSTNQFNQSIQSIQLIQSIDWSINWTVSRKIQAQNNRLLNDF